MRRSQRKRRMTQVARESGPDQTRKTRVAAEPRGAEEPAVVGAGPAVDTGRVLDNDQLERNYVSVGTMTKTPEAHGWPSQPNEGNEVIDVDAMVQVNRSNHFEINPDPTAVLSVHSELGFHVSSATKNKVLLG